MFDLKGIDRRLMPYAKVFQQGNGFALGVNISPYDEAHFLRILKTLPFFFPSTIRNKFFLNGIMKEWEKTINEILKEFEKIK